MTHHRKGIHLWSKIINTINHIHVFHSVNLWYRYVFFRKARQRLSEIVAMNYKLYAVDLPENTIRVIKNLCNIVPTGPTRNHRFIRIIALMIVDRNG